MTQESRLIISIDARNAANTARELNRELQNITQGGNQADRQVNQLGSSLRSLAGYMAGIVTVGAAINKMDTYTGLQNRLKLVTNSQVELNKATKDTFDIAQRSGQVWGEVAMVYQRFADNAKKLNITQAQTAALTETVSKSIAISGGSAASAEAALMQFGQALASGVLRGEEFNSIAEQAPALLKAIATGLEVDIGQLRAMAKDGKLTGDIVVGALEKAKVSVDNLFSKTDVTIGQSFTVLNNAVTQFVGEAGKGSGAASLLSESIRSLGENLSTIADVAIVGGIALMTKAILTKTVAIHGAIAASITQRATETALAESQIRLLALEVQRTRQVAALALTEAGLARVEYNNATTRTARAAATIRLTQAEIALGLATNRTTAAIAAETAAQSALNASRTLGARALALVGGPIGAITIGVAALAAGYMVMKNNTAEATAKLEEQAKVASKTTDELLKLEGAQASQARSDLAAAFKAQNDELKKSSTLIGNYIAELSSKNTADAQTAEILLKVRTNAMSFDDALKTLNKTYADKPEIISKLKAEIEKYDEARQKAQENANAQKTLGVEVKLAGNAAQNAVAQHNAVSGAIDNVASSAEAASKAMQDYNKSLRSSDLENLYESGYIQQGRTPAQAKALVEAQKAKGLDSGILTEEEKNTALESVAIAERKNKLVDEYNKKLSDGNKKQKDALSAAKKEQKEAEQLAKEQAEDRVSIAYTYLDDLQKMEEDYQKEITSIRKANFGAEQKEFEDRAKARYDFDHEMYLIQITEEINSFKWSDNEKLNHWKRTQEEIINNSGRYNDQIKKLKINALDEEYALEKATILLRKQEREFQVKEQFMTETNAMIERYRLEEANILRINDASERSHLLEMSRLKKEVETQDRLNKAKAGIDAINSTRNGTGEFDAIYSTQAEANNASQEMLDAQIAAGYENTERLQKEHLDRMVENARVAKMALLSLELNYGEQITGSFANMFASMRGEQSKGYKIMFAASKAFAIAQSAIAISQGIAMAAANPFPLNLVAMATVASQTASLVANIRAIKDVGFQTGGYTGGGGVSDVAGVVHGQEYVLNAQATKRVGVDTLNAINSGGDLKSSSPVNIVINTPQGYTATTNQNGDTVTIDIVEQMINQSWSNVKNPNSNESRAMQSAYILNLNR